MSAYCRIKSLTSYVSGNMNHQPRFVTAIGALVDGKANCQGYTDAFYMLGRMLGLNVGRISGTANNEPHQWNTITYSDGKTYFVDVTWDDQTLTYTNREHKGDSFFYFNAPVEIMQVTHSWDWSSAPENIQPSVDNRYSYMGYSWTDNLARTNSAEAGLKLLAEKAPFGNIKWFSVMTPYDERYNTPTKAIPYFNKALNATGKKITCWLHVKPFGKYMFITADTWD